MARNLQYPPSVKPGLPRLGETPKGWSRVTFGDVLQVVEREALLNDDDEYQLVVARRNRGGIAPRERLLGREILTKSQFLVNSGDFLISKRQIVHGACGIVPAELHGSVVSNEYAVLHSRDGLNLKYLEYYTHSLHFQQTCFHSSVGVAVEKMIFRLDEWLQHEFDLPPRRVQDYFVDVLSTWDQAISEVQALIAATLQVKAGLAQELLTGQRRLPGFSDPWHHHNLDNVATVLFSNVDKKSTPGEQTVQLCNYMDVYHNNEISLGMPFMLATATDAEIAKFAIKRWDVIITKDSETPDDIAKPAVVTEDLPGVICGYHLAIVRCNSHAHGPFIAQLFRLPRIRREFMKIANGATRYGLGQASLGKLSIELPSVDEQLRIAQVLGASDREVVLLQRTLTLLVQQQRGLLQKLVTGQGKVKA